MPKKVVVHCNSQSAIHLVKNQVHHGRTNHYHFIQEIIENGIVSLAKINTKDNLVDMLTKVSPLTKF